MNSHWKEEWVYVNIILPVTFGLPVTKEAEGQQRNWSHQSVKFINEPGMKDPQNNVDTIDTHLP